MGIYGAIFCSSLGALSFEILLSRIFSIALWYHFAFMVVSIAMLGLGASGTVVAALWTVGGKKPVLRASYFFLQSVSMAAAYLIAVRIPFDPVSLAWDPVQLLNISLYYLTLSTPFFMAGTILASAFALGGEKAGSLYAADLAGGAAGTVLVIMAQTRLSPGQAVFLSAACPLVGVLVLAPFRLRIMASLTLAALVIVAVVNPPFIRERMSPYKELPTLLRMAGAEEVRSTYSPFGRADLFRSPGVRHAPGLSLKYQGSLPDQMGLAVDGGAVTAVTTAFPSGDAAFLEYLPTSFAFSIRGADEVLLVDPRGGIPHLLARQFSPRRVDCSESSPAAAGILAHEGIDLDPCRRGLTEGPGRIVAAMGGGRYSLIDVPLTGALPAGHLGGGEDYQLTVEAFAAYLNGLEEEGILQLSIYIAPPYRSELRLFATLLSALEHVGAKDPPRHVAALRSLGLFCILVRRSPFPDEELAGLGDFTDRLWFDPVYLAGRPLPGGPRYIRTEGADLAEACAVLADPRRAGSFADDYAFDISPATDDRPYFHDHLKAGTFGKVWELVEGKWDFFIYEGYILPVIFAQVLLLGFLFIVLPASFAGRRRLEGSGVRLRYFAFLGLGYMLFEVGMIQRLLLPLEHPVYAMAVVLGTLLVASGTGSYVARRRGAGDLWKVSAAVAVAALIYLAAVGPFSRMVLGLPLWQRGIGAGIFLFPAGLLMGMPFPGGIRALTASSVRLIPWAWAVNGFFSVLAPVMAAMVARSGGFRVVLLLAALSYFGAARSGRAFCASPTMGTKRTPPI